MPKTVHQNYKEAYCHRTHTLSLVVHTEVCEAKLLHIVFEGGNLRPTVRLTNESVDVLEILTRNGTV